tara:strand:- start:4617 stop:8369 length:3753 start_codon:yes stop_codon:yes gene_type:complete
MSGIKLNVVPFGYGVNANTKVINVKTGRKLKLFNKKKKLNPKIKKLLKQNYNNIEFDNPNLFVDRKTKTINAVKIKGKSTPQFLSVFNNNAQRVRVGSKFVFDTTNKKVLTRTKILTDDGKLKDIKYNQNKKLTMDKRRLLSMNTKSAKPLKTASNEKVNKIKDQYLTVRNIFNLDEEPNSLEEFKDIVDDALKTNFSYNERQRPVRLLLLRFGDGEDEYRYVPLDDVDTLEEVLDDMEKGGWGSDNSMFNVGTLDMTWFQISLSSKVPSASVGSRDNKMNNICNYWFINQPITKDNLCLEGAIKRHLELKERTLSIRKNMIKKYPNNIVLGEEIKICDLVLYENEYKVNINLFDDTPQRTLLYNSENKHENSMECVYKENHIMLIQKPKNSLKEIKQKKNKKWKQKNPKVKIPKLPIKYVVFDIETIFDRYDFNFLKPYSISWFIWEEGKEFNYDPKTHLEPPYCYYSNGEGCVEDFVRFLMNGEEGFRYLPFGFNNSKFDNIFVCAEARKLGVLEDIFFTGNSILSCKFRGCEKVWDTSRFLTGQSLDMACKNYNTNPKKAKDLIDHYEIQCYYEQKGWNGLVKLLEDNDDLVLYNKIDCICLLDLTLKMKNTYEELFGENIFKSMTVSSYAYKELVKTWKDNGLDNIVRAKDYETDKFFRESLTAGRTQSFYGKIDLEMDLAMGDIKSLYPTVMGSYGENDCPYPYGDYHKTEEYKEGKLGIYNVNIIHQRTLWKNQAEVYKQFDYIKKKTGYDLYRQYAPNVIALREKDKPLNWFHKGKIENVNLTSVDIDVLRWATEDYDCVEINYGYYWDDKSYDLFKYFLDPPKDEKTRQDKLKADKSKEYNECKREVCKGISNSVSGKVIEKIHEDCSDIFSNKTYIKWSKDEKITDLEINDLGNKFQIMNGKKTAEDIFEDMKEERKKPAYLGVFIYSYARKLMYQKLLSRYVNLYMDTDSCCMPKSEWLRLCKENEKTNFVNTGEYGCIEEEVCGKRDNGEIIWANRLIAIAPKNYLVENKECEYLSKRKFKGVRKTDNWLPLTEFGTYQRVEKINKKGEIVKKLEGSAIEKIRGDIKKKIKPMGQDEIRRIRESKCCIKCIKNNEKECKECLLYRGNKRQAYSTEMFEYLVKDKKICVFCSMITRKKYIVKKDIETDYSNLIKKNGFDTEEYSNIKTDEISIKLIPKSKTQKSNELIQFKKDNKKLHKENIKEFYKKWDLFFNKYDEVGSTKEIKEIFEMKQSYMIKLI